MRNDLPYIPFNSIKELGALIRRRRKEAKVSIQTFAETIGVSPRFISELERGRENIAADKLLLIAKLIGIDLFARPRS